MVLKANQQEQENHLILKPTLWLYLLDGASNLIVQLQQLHGWQLPCPAVTVSMSDPRAPFTLLALPVFTVQFPELSQQRIGWLCSKKGLENACNGGKREAGLLLLGALASAYECTIRPNPEFHDSVCVQDTLHETKNVGLFQRTLYGDLNQTFRTLIELPVVIKATQKGLHLNLQSRFQNGFHSCHL